MTSLMRTVTLTVIVRSLVVISCLFVGCPDDKFGENCDIDCHCQVPCSDILFICRMS